MQLPAVALFPDWLGEHDDDVTNYGKEAEEMRLIGDQFRVGTMRQTGDDKFAFIMGQSGAIWNSTSGWSKTAPLAALNCVSDRGSQYCSYDYPKKLQAYGLRPSMSGKGNCYDI